VGVWSAISYDWKSELVFLKRAGKKGITCNNYLEQALKPVVGPAFQGQKGIRREMLGVCMSRMEHHCVGSKRSCESLEKSCVFQGMYYPSRNSLPNKERGIWLQRMTIYPNPCSQG